MPKCSTALGLMSGTSLDGIDIALVETDGEDVVRRGPARTYPYDQRQRERLMSALEEAKRLTDRQSRPGSLAADSPPRSCRGCSDCWRAQTR